MSSINERGVFKYTFPLEFDWALNEATLNIAIHLNRESS